MYNTAHFLYFIDKYCQHTFLSLDIYMATTSSYFTMLTSVIFWHKLWTIDQHIYLFLKNYNNAHFILTSLATWLSHSSLVVSKHGLYVGGLGSIPTAITTRTAAGGDAEHVSLNHWLAPPYQGVKLVPAKCWEDSYRCWPWVGCKWLMSHHLKVMAHTKVGWVPCWELKCKVVR